jgi:predicted nucleic acid-binding protein
MARRKPKRPTAFVLDGSVTLAWFFEDESNAYTESVQDALPDVSGVVPTIWHLEVANGLLVGERRKRTTEAKVRQFLSLLEVLPITVDEQTSGRAWSDTVALARAHRLSAYDAVYLELARRRTLPLATHDGPLRDAAKAVGIALYRP